MHIPDGYISPQTAGGLWALMVPAWYWAGHRVKSAISARQAPLVAIGAAFTFVIMMFNVPLPGGTTGHAVGGTIIAIVVGPWAAVISISVALFIQALFFGDGGILALGANCFNMAFALPVTGYLTYRLISGGAPERSPRRWLAAGIGAYVGLTVAALLTAVEFGLQGDLFRAADGSALYSPYGLSTAVPAIMIPHLLVVGFIEGGMTSLVFIFLGRTDPALLANHAHSSRTAAPFRLKPLIIGLVLLTVFAPLGLLAAGSAWGEWSTEELGQQVGYVPQGMERFAGIWKGVLPDYALPADESEAPPGTPLAADKDAAAPEATAAAADASGSAAGAISIEDAQDSTPAYLVSGVLGLLLAGGLALMSVRLLGRSRRDLPKGEQVG